MVCLRLKGNLVVNCIGPDYDKIKRGLYFIFCFGRLATSKTGIGSVACVVPISDITQTLGCVSPQHMHVYDREMLPRRFHYINSDRIGDVVMLMDEKWQAEYR